MEIYFWFRKSTTSNLHGSLSYVIRIDGMESVLFSTKIKTEKKLWNSKSQCFEGKGSAIKEHARENLVSQLFQIHRELLSEKNGEQIYPDDISDVKPILTVRICFLSYYYLCIRPVCDAFARHGFSFVSYKYTTNELTLKKTF